MTIVWENHNSRPNKESEGYEANGHQRDRPSTYCTNCEARTDDECRLLFNGIF